MKQENWRKLPGMQVWELAGLDNNPDACYLVQLKYRRKGE